MAAAQGLKQKAGGGSAVRRRRRRGDRGVLGLAEGGRWPGDSGFRRGGQGAHVELLPAGKAEGEPQRAGEGAGEAKTTCGKGNWREKQGFAQVVIEK